MGLAGCGSDDTTAGAQDASDTTTSAATSSSSPAETSSGPSSGVDRSSGQTPSAPQTQGQPETESREGLLSALTEVSASGYEDRTQNSGGIRFMTESGTVNCHLGSGGFACLVPDHAEWPADQRADDGLDGMGVPKAIGWGWAVGGTPFGGVPHHWAVQGMWPSPVESGPLKEGAEGRSQRGWGRLPGCHLWGGRRCHDLHLRWSRIHGVGGRLRHLVTYAYRSRCP